MTKKRLHQEIDVLRIILSSYNETAPMLHQKLHDQRIEIKRLKVLNDELRHNNEDCYGTINQLLMEKPITTDLTNRELYENASELSEQRLVKLNECAAMNRKLGLENGKLTEETELLKLEIKTLEAVNKPIFIPAILEEENTRLKLIVEQYRDTVAKLEQYNQAGNSKLKQLENRELELLAEIEDLKNKYTKDNESFTIDIPTLDRQEVAGDHVYKNITEDLE